MMPTLAIMAIAVASAATTTLVRESDAVRLRARQQSPPRASAPRAGWRD